MPTPLKEALAKSKMRDGKPIPYADLPVVGKFKVLRGKHIEGGVIYETGDVVESKSDLTTLDTKKFAKVSSKKGKATSAPVNDDEDDQDDDILGSGQATEDEADDENLGSLTVAELRELAADEGVELRGSMTKAEIIQAIKNERNEG